MDQFNRLKEWYSAQCNGDWEHSYGISIETLDNPGWSLEIDLSDTELQDRHFEPVHRGDSEDDASWLHCIVSNNRFQASGGISDMPAMLGVFLQWAGR